MNMNITYTTATRETDNKARILVLIGLIKAEEVTYNALVAEVIADPHTTHENNIYRALPGDPRTTSVIQSTNRLEAYWNELNTLRARTLDTADYVSLLAWHATI